MSCYYYFLIAKKLTKMVKKMSEGNERVSDTLQPRLTQQVQQDPFEALGLPPVLIEQEPQ